MPKVIKPSNPFTNCLLGFCFKEYFLRRHKFWLHRQFSSAQFQKRRKRWVMVLVLLLLICFEQ